MSIIEDDIFYGVDLHVHTPASICYRGDRSDREYLGILKRYYLKDIRVIAITDHNSIKGYEKLLEIKSRLQNEYEILNKYLTDQPLLIEQLNKIKEDLSLFEHLLILPGIEFEAKPGIHLLIIFDPKTDINIINNFLLDAGYSDNDQGCEIPSIQSKYDVLDVLKKAYEYRAITIAAHADSDKGIYGLKGNYRAEIFKSNYLWGISYNNPNTCIKMKALLQNEEYRREKPIAFIQSNDYHGENDPGSRISYFKLNEINYTSLCNAFDTPNESISIIKNPKILNILTQVVTDPKCHVISNIESENDWKILQRKFCAVLNDGYGIIIIGAILKPHIEFVGVNIKSDECRTKIDYLLKGIISPFEVSIKEHKFGERIVISIDLKSGNNLLYYIKETKEALIFDDQYNIVIAEPSEIVRKVENKILTKMGEYDKINQQKLDNLIRETNDLKNNYKQFLLINKLEKELHPLKYYIDLEFVEPTVNNIHINNEHGHAEGKMYFVSESEPRLPYAYLRCSCPCTNEYDFNNLELKKYSGKKIVLVPGGGTYLIDGEGEWAIINLTRYPALLINIKNEYKDKLCEKSLLAWFKSSLFLWYVSKINSGNFDLYIPSLFNKISIPIIGFGCEGKIEYLVSNIISNEMSFLNNEGRASELEKSEISAMIDEHNKIIEELAFEIDLNIFNLLKVGNNEIKMIQDFFDGSTMYNILKNIEDIK